MVQIWFTSDTHFAHLLVAKERGYTTTTAHDNAIIAAWNKQVQPEDTVHHLGDVGMGAITRFAHILAKLNGHKHLITGNHDAVHPSTTRISTARHQAYLEHFETISQFGAIKYLGVTFTLSHFPYSGEGNRPEPDRYPQWRLRDLGNPLIHGHTHDKNQKFSRSTEGTPMIHVGWDAWRRPIRISEIAEQLETGTKEPAP